MRPESREGADSLGDSITSVNFEESADAEEVMRMLEQGPPKKDPGMLPLSYLVWGCILLIEGERGRWWRQ